MRLFPSSFNRQAVRPSLNRLRQGHWSRPLAWFSARFFAAAEVSGPAHAVQALGPGTLGQIGRALIQLAVRSVYYLDVQDGQLLMIPCESWDVGGGSMPSSWTYRLSLGGPDRTMTIDPVQAAGVVHCKYATDPSRPWKGVGPIQSAALAGRLSAETSKGSRR